MGLDGDAGRLKDGGNEGVVRREGLGAEAFDFAGERAEVIGQRLEPGVVAAGKRRGDGQRKPRPGGRWGGGRRSGGIRQLNPRFVEGLMGPPGWTHCGRLATGWFR